MLVRYNNKEYFVKSPGVLLRNDKNYLLDQLHKDLPCMGRYRTEYLLNNYNLSEFDYYLIVMCLGDINNIPLCEYEGCNNHKKFNTLGITKKVPILSKGCCEKHSKNLARKDDWIRYNKIGKNPLENVDWSSIWTTERRIQASNRELEKVKNGTHPWLLKNSKEFREKLIEEGKNPIVNMWKSRDEIISPSLDIYDPKKMNDIDYVLFSEKESFKNRENKDDICQFYIAELDDNSFKIGVTKDVENRIKKNRYHKMKYKNTKVLYESNRVEVAELEYKIKRKFIKKVKLGTESFSMNDYDEILEYINSLINNPCIN